MLIVSVAVTLSACSPAPTEVRAGQSTDGFDPPNPPNSTPMTQPCEARMMSSEGASVGLNTAVNRAAVGVVGRYESIDPPRYNAAEGLIGGDATVRVQAVIFDSVELRVRPGDLLTVYMSAVNTCGISSYADYGGSELAVGQRRLLLLDPWRQGRLTGGGWRLEPGKEREMALLESRPAWNGPSDTVMNRIREERTAGLDPHRDAASMDRPFG